MAARRVADRHRAEGERQHRAVIEREDAGDRPHPALRRRRKPHRFRPRKLGERFADERRQHLARRPAGPVDHREIKDAAAGVALLALGERGEAGRLEEALDRRGRRADAGPAPLLAHVALLRRQAGDGQRQPARRHEAPRPHEAQPGGAELLRDDAVQIVRRGALHPRRDFLGQELEQEIGHHAPASQPSQHALASARTRPI